MSESSAPRPEPDFVFWRICLHESAMRPPPRPEHVLCVFVCILGVCMCVCMCVCVCVCVHLHTYIYMHTYIDTYIFAAPPPPRTVPVHWCIFTNYLYICTLCLCIYIIIFAAHPPKPRTSICPSIYFSFSKSDLYIDSLYMYI